MGLLIRPYELTLWFDQWVDGTGFQEQRFAIIGSDKLTDACRATNVKLTTNVNGKATLTFSMFYHYVDTSTGAETDNPYTPYLVNERKVRLRYEDKWYDFIIRNVDKDSTNKKYDYTAEDANVLELSKNGFNVELHEDLGNNQGTIRDLATTILDGSGWTVADSSDKIVQKVNEALVRLKTDTALTAYKIIDNTLASGQGVSVASTTTSIPQNVLIYGFYSCCKDKSYRFQFIYKSDGIYTVDDDRIITDLNCQYVIDNMTYHTMGTTETSSEFGIFVPQGCSVSTVTGTQEIIDPDKRGNRYGFVQLRAYDTVLEKYVYQCKYPGANNNTAYYYAKTEYVSPELIKNYVTNPNVFKSTSGWNGAYSACDASLYNKTSLYQTTCEVTSYSATSGNSYQYDVLKDTTISYQDLPDDYESVLNINFKEQANNSYGLLINSGFYDQRKSIGGLTTGKQYVLYFRIADGSSLPACSLKVAAWDYDTAASCYKVNPANANAYLTFNLSGATQYGTTAYYYKIATVNNYNNITDKEFQNTVIRSFIYRNNNDAANIKIYDMQIFPYVPSSNSSVPILPSNQPINTTINTTYYYYDPVTNSSITDPDSYIYLHEGDQLSVTTYSPKFDDYAQSIRSIEIKETNYWNAIQSLCEKFNCWVEPIINRDASGKVLTRQLRFRNYIGQENHVGFKYGVNLTSIKRSVKSDAFTTKLIVKSNNNENANNGVCTIANAPSNDIGESYIWNFTYYFNKDMLNATQYLANVDAITALSSGEDMSLWGRAQSTTYTCQGYWPRLRKLNAQIEQDTLAVSSLLLSVTYCNSDIQTYKAARDAAEDSLISSSNAFKNEFGYGWDEILGNSVSVEIRSARKAQCKSISVQKLLCEIYEYKKAYDLNNTKWEDAKKALNGVHTQSENIDGYLDLYNNAKANLKLHTSWKSKLNKAFYLVYHRFIHEGTWTSSEYISDEEYYIDAQSVSSESALPQVSYNLSVSAIDALDGYDILKYNLGDQTYIEDKEFFGVNSSGAPYREEVAVTEIVRSLDDPTQDSIKIQNYSNQFDDLFHAMGATVQTVQYTKSANQRATSLALATDQQKVKYLAGALSDMSNVISNAGEQSVVWDNTGITITNKAEPSKQMKLNSSGLLLRETNEAGQEEWVLGISADGICADTITSGALNTGKLQILNGDEPYFLWDSYGLTAYEFDVSTSTGAQHGKNTNKGVRFDRFGIYGFSGIDGSTWHPPAVLPTSDDDDTLYVRRFSTFELTKHGLFLNLAHATLKKYAELTDAQEIIENKWLGTPIQHNSRVYLGDTNSHIYDHWTTTSISAEGTLSVGKPYYNPGAIAGRQPQFMKVMSIEAQTGTSGDTPIYTEQFALYDDGTLIANKAIVRGTIYAEAGYFTGTVISNSATIGGWKVNSSGFSSEDNTCFIYSSGITTPASVQPRFASNDDDYVPLIARANEPDNNANPTVIVKFGDHFKVYSNGTVEATGSITANGISIKDNSDQAILEASGSGTASPTVTLAGWSATVSKFGNDNFFLDSSATTTGIAAKFGENFKVTAAGNVTMSGTITATNSSFSGSVEANQGTIGGWHLAEEGLYNNDTPASATMGLASGASGSQKMIWAGATTGASATDQKFYVTANGDLYATEGQLGGWHLRNAGFYNTSSGAATFYMRPPVEEDEDSTVIVKFGDHFTITKNGTVSVEGNIEANGMVVKNVTTSGSATVEKTLFSATGSGTSDGQVTIGGWTVDEHNLHASSNSVGMSSSSGDAFWAGRTTKNGKTTTKFLVNSSGHVEAKDITLSDTVTVGAFSVGSNGALVVNKESDAEQTAINFLSLTETFKKTTGEVDSVDSLRLSAHGLSLRLGTAFDVNYGIYSIHANEDFHIGAGGELSLGGTTIAMCNDTSVAGTCSMTKLNIANIHSAAPTTSDKGVVGDIWIYTT